MIEDYRKARKIGAKQVQEDVSAGRYPYPVALSDILKDRGYQGEVPLGVMDIDMGLIAGTRTRGRQNSFSRGFMPLLEEGSEFAAKWSALADSQRDEGIREPIIVYEYLQRFYVQEGNKRVSVARFVGMPTIAANVTRVLPMPADTKEMRVYREFLRFFAVCPVYGIVFSEEGSYERLAAFAGFDLETPWSEDAVRALRSAYGSFAEAFGRRGGGSLGIAAGDAFLTYLKLYGYELAVCGSPTEISERLSRIWGELRVAASREPIAYLETPGAPSRAKLIPDLKGLAKKVLPVTKPLRIAFVYERGPATSGWAAAHERGRHDLEGLCGETVETRAFYDRRSDEAFDRAVEEAVAGGDDLVVTNVPTQMRQALRAALAHPGLKVMNCSVSLSHSAVRTFATKTYEVKFLLGVLAASLSDNHRVGYVADSPVFGTVAGINAFAIGAQTVDPHATVYLKWYASKDYDWRRELAESEVRIVCARDVPDPADPSQPWGLYLVEHDGTHVHLAEPVWEWGRFYQRIVQSIRDDSWRREGDELRGRALNYWWGLTSGVMDVRVDAAVPARQRALVELFRQGLLGGQLHPFSGELKSQRGLVQPEGSGRLASDAIARMAWLNENVVGRLPVERELSERALDEVTVSGVIPLDPTAAARREAKR